MTGFGNSINPLEMKRPSRPEASGLHITAQVPGGGVESVVEPGVVEPGWYYAIK